MARVEISQLVVANVEGFDALYGVDQYDGAVYRYSYEFRQGLPPRYGWVPLSMERLEPREPTAETIPDEELPF